VIYHYVSVLTAGIHESMHATHHGPIINRSFVTPYCRNLFLQHFVGIVEENFLAFH
jgi:hypothetical protein